MPVSGSVSRRTLGPIGAGSTPLGGTWIPPAAAIARAGIRVLEPASRWQADIVAGPVAAGEKGGEPVIGAKSREFAAGE